MRRLRHRLVRFPLGALLERATPLLLAAMLAGCATTPLSSPGPVASTQASPTRLAADGAGVATLLSPQRAAAQNDEATEPYSLLYGSRASYRLGTTAAEWSPAKEDAIIAQAITAHEMRRP